MSLTDQSTGFFGRHKWVAWAAMFAAVILLASFMSRDEGVPVRTAIAVHTSIRSVVSTNGKIEPLQNFEAHAPAGTTVSRLLVKEGEHVKKGQLLVQMNDAEARSTAARALAQMRTAQADLNAIQGGGT